MRQGLSLLAVGFFAVCLVFPQSSGDPIDQAIRDLRILAKADPSRPQSEEEMRRFGNACQAVKAAGQKGVERLEAELSATGHEPEDEVFRVSLSALLYDIAGPDKAPQVAAAWSTIDRFSRAEMTYFVAFQAAGSQDPRVTPMLKACVADEKGSVIDPIHGVILAWPRTAEALWGACGLPCESELRRMFLESEEPVETASAAAALAKSMYPDLMPRYRFLAEGGHRPAQLQSILALGWYGHPDDFDFLVAGLGSKEPDVLFTYIYALVEFGDIRATRQIMRLVSHHDRNVRGEAAAACMLLPTARSVEKVIQSLGTKKAPEIPGLKERVDALMTQMGTDVKAFLALPDADREKLVRRAIEAAEAPFRLKEDEKALGRERVMRDLEDCLASGKVSGWIDPKQFLAVATPDDIPLLLKLRAQAYQRFSSRAFDDVALVDQMIRRLGRSRYRKEVGLIAETGRQ